MYIMSNYKIETECVQGGYSPKNGEPRVLPIVQSTTYKYDSADDVGALFDLKKEGFYRLYPAAILSGKCQKELTRIVHQVFASVDLNKRIQKEKEKKHEKKST